MRTETTTKTLYKFDELSDKSKEKAIEKLRTSDYYLDHDWWEFVYEESIIIGNLFGLCIDRIFFSGFSFQGDGACFEGRYAYRKGALKDVQTYAPQDKELHRIVKGLQEAQRKSFYQLEARVKHSGFYSHSGCTHIDVAHAEDSYRDIGDAEDDINDLLRCYMNWIYKCLRDEYDWHMADEQVAESLSSHDCEFLVDGTAY